MGKAKTAPPKYAHKGTFTIWHVSKPFRLDNLHWGLFCCHPGGHATPAPPQLETPFLRSMGWLPSRLLGPLRKHGIATGLWLVLERLPNNVCFKYPRAYVLRQIPNRGSLHSLKVNVCQVSGAQDSTGLILRVGVSRCIAPVHKILEQLVPLRSA